MRPANTDPPPIGKQVLTWSAADGFAVATLRQYKDMNPYWWVTGNVKITSDPVEYEDSDACGCHLDMESPTHWVELPTELP